MASSAAATVRDMMTKNGVQSTSSVPVAPDVVNDRSRSSD